MTVQLSNLEHLPNYQITERLDVVYGSTVRSKHVGKDLFAGLKNIVGGELTAYTELLEESRQEAIDRMVVKAEALGADAVVGLRFSTSSIAKVHQSCLSMVQRSKPSRCLSNHRAITLVIRISIITITIRVTAKQRLNRQAPLLMICHVSTLLVNEP